MERHDLVFRSITSNTGKSFQNLTENEASIVKKFRQDFHSIIHSKNIKPENIFNSDQTGIYYWIQPTKIIDDKGKKDIIVIVENLTTKKRMAFMPLVNLDFHKNYLLLLLLLYAIK